MRLDDILYFAPGVRFSEVDLSGTELPSQFERRLRGFYLDPAVLLAKSNHAFASGLVLISCIEALARVQTVGKKGDGQRFKDYIKNELKSFKDDDIAERLWEDFRNGLVHEARIKEGGQFSLDPPHTVDFSHSILTVNPLALADEVSDALSNFVTSLKSDGALLDRFLKQICSDFADELEK